MNRKQKANLIKHFLCFVDHKFGGEIRIAEEHEGETWWICLNNVVEDENEIINCFLDEFSETDN